MTKREIMIKAHKMTKEVKKEFPNVNYKFQFGLCLSYILEEERKEVVKMKELKGTEKQIKWAEDLREQLKSSMEVVEDMAILMQDCKNEKMNKTYAVIKAEYDEVMNRIENEEMAKWFIDNRYTVSRNSGTVNGRYEYEYRWLNVGENDEAYKLVNKLYKFASTSKGKKALGIE